MDSLLRTPLFFESVYKQYVWGGERFAKRLGRVLPNGTYAEAWEISDHPDGITPILAGPLAGLSLSEAIARTGTGLAGKSTVPGGRFPLLVKLIDAAETLSVQVHPDEAAAARFGGEAKSEMWVVLEATPDAHIYSGFRPGTDEAAVRRALAAGTVEEVLQRFPARPGMVFSTPGGRVHAIGAGCLLLEVQQDANTTYRLDDWGRTDASGASRPLHVEEALRVVDWTATGSPVAKPEPLDGLPEGLAGRRLLSDAHYVVDEFAVSAPCWVENPSDGFLVLFSSLADGVRIRPEGETAVRLPPARACLIPAAMRRFRLSPDGDRPGRLFLAREP
jgi:mannose-6-phosphate isomerase